MGSVKIGGFLFISTASPLNLIDSSRTLACHGRIPPEGAQAATPGQQAQAAGESTIAGGSTV